jgi:hypothetical protein
MTDFLIFNLTVSGSDGLLNRRAIISNLSVSYTTSAISLGSDQPKCVFKVLAKKYQ